MRRLAALLVALPLLMGQAKPVLVPDVSQRNIEIAYSFTGGHASAHKNNRAQAVLRTLPKRIARFRCVVRARRA